MKFFQREPNGATKKSVTLRALTVNPQLVEHFAPTRLSKMTPDWWKATPQLVPERANRMPPPGAPPHVPPPAHQLALTVKHCYALRELFNRAIALPLWSDYVVMVAPDGRTWSHSPQQGKAGDQHPPAQYPGMLKGWAHHKLICPWLLSTDEPIHFYYAHPFYHFPEPDRFQVMPGVTEFHWQNRAHANLIFPKGSAMKEYMLRVGEPIAYLIPLDDVRITVKAEEVTSTEFDRLISSHHLSFHYHKLNKRIDSTIRFKSLWKRFTLF